MSKVIEIAEYEYTSRLRTANERQTPLLSVTLLVLLPLFMSRRNPWHVPLVRAVQYQGSYLVLIEVVWQTPDENLVWRVWHNRRNYPRNNWHIIYKRNIKH